MAEKQRINLTKTEIQQFERIRHLSQLKDMDPIAFEKFVGYLYERNGYMAYMTVTSGDEGVDLYLRRGMKTAVVQCKRYGGTVGQPVVRDLYGAMIHNKANEAMLVTSGTISRQAEEWVQDKPIQLIDGHELLGWTRRTRMGLGSLSKFWRIAIGVVLVMVLCGLLTAGGLALFTYQQRTANTTASPPATFTPVPTPEDQDAVVTPTLAPTRQVNTTPPIISSNNVPVTYFDTLPQLDGDLTEWAGLTAVAITHITEREDSWDGSMDLEAYWQMGWDERNLYFAVTIEDNIHVQLREPKFAYLGDSLELQLDTDRMGDFAAEVNQDDFQYVISPGDFAALRPGAFRFQGNDENWPAEAPGTNAQVTAVATTNGYIIEGAIPWTDINVRPMEGLILGAALSVNDNDSAGTAVQELMLSHVDGRLWRDPTSWGTMTLLAPK